MSKITERLRLSSLKSLRERMIRLEHVEYDELNLVLGKFDWFMIENMLNQHEREIEWLKDARHLAPEHVKDFLSQSLTTGHRLAILHSEWSAAKSKPMAAIVMKRVLGLLKQRHADVMKEVKGLNRVLEGFGPFEFRYIQRPCERAKPYDYVPARWILSEHDFSLRYPWYYHWHDKRHVNGRLTTYQAAHILCLWQIESHLGLPRTFQKELNWYPVVNVGPVDKPFKP